MIWPERNQTQVHSISDRPHDNVADYDDSADDDDIDYDYEDDYDIYDYDANDNHLLMLSMTVSSRAVSRSGLSRLAPSWDISFIYISLRC